MRALLYYILPLLLVLCPRAQAANRAFITSETIQCALALMGPHLNDKTLAALPALEPDASELYPESSASFRGYRRVTALKNPEAAGKRWPLQAVSLTNRRSIVAGAHCFNATMLWMDGGFSPGPMDGDVMETYLRRDFRTVPAGAPLAFGDVIAIWSAGVLHHTAVVVSPTLVWHKASEYSVDPYTFENTIQVVASYLLGDYPYPADALTVHRYNRPERHGLHRLVSSCSSIWRTPITE